MKILAFGDTQIGVRTVDLADQAAVLDRIIAVALERNVDLVIHGGDVFEGPVVTPEHLRVFLDGVRPLRTYGRQIPLLVLRGNGRHDSATRPVHALDVLREVAGIVVSDRPELHSLAGLGIVTLPWVHPGAVIAQWDGDVDHDRVNEYAAKLLVEIAKRMMPASPSILVAHWGISGSALPTGLPVEQMREPVLSWPDLDAIGFDAIIGAHIHEPQRIDRAEIGDATVGVVVGSPQQLSFGEKGEHGCWILDIEAGGAGSAVSVEFVPIESKRFETVDLDDEWLDLLGDETTARGIEWTPGRGDMIRVRYSATEEQARRIDHFLIRDALIDAGASRVQIEPRILRESRARAETLTEDLGPLEALHMYADAQGLDDATNGRMVERLRSWMQA